MAIDKNKAIANAQRFTQKGQLDRALKEYLAIVAEEPEDVRIWLKIGDLYTKKGAVPQAVATYGRVAVYYSERGFFLKAVAVWKQILNIDPSYSEAHLKLAELYVQLGLAPDAIGQYQLVVGAYEREGRHRDSLGLLKKVVELAPDDIPNRIRLAEAFARQSENPKAVEEFKVVLEQLHARERWEEALQVGERVAYLAPDDVENLRSLSEVYLRRGDARRALARLQACFKANPTDLRTLELLARAFGELGQVPKAVSVHRELARLHEEASNHPARLEAFRRILALDPTDVEAISVTGGGRTRETQKPLPPQVLFTQGVTSTQGMQRLGAVAQPVEILTPAEQVQRHLSDIELLLKYGLGEHALQTTEKILGIEPDHEDALVKRKDIANAIGRRDEAVAALLRLAAVAEKRSLDQAMAWLGEVLQLSPHNTEATQRMQRLSSGMAAGLRSSASRAVPAVIEAAPPDDYPDLDLDALDFSDGAALDVSRGPEPEGELDGLDDLEFGLDVSPAPAAPATASALEVEPAPPAEDDFGDLVGGEDDFEDLLRDEPPRSIPPEASIEQDFGDLLGDEAAATRDVPPPPKGAGLREELGDLLVGEHAASSGHLTPVAQMLGIPGAPTPQPLADDFGDLGPINLPDDDFSDLLSDEARPTAPVPDELDFGDLLAESPPASASTPPIPPPAPGKATNPLPSDVLTHAAARMLTGTSAPPAAAAPPTPTPAVPAPHGAADEATSFDLGDLLPDDLESALAEAAAAVAATVPTDETEAGPDDSDEQGTFEPPPTTGADDAQDSVEFNFDFADLEGEAGGESAAADSILDPVPAEPPAEDAPEPSTPGDPVEPTAPPAPASGLRDVSRPAPVADDERGASISVDIDVEADSPFDSDEEPTSGFGDEDVEAMGGTPAAPPTPVPTPLPAADAPPVQEPADAVADLAVPSEASASAEQSGELPSEPEVEEPAAEHAAPTPAVDDALHALAFSDPPRGVAPSSDVASALMELLPSESSLPPATADVADALGDLSGDIDEDAGDYEDPDRKVFAQPDAVTKSASAVARTPAPVSPAVDALPEDDSAELEADVASLPGLALNLSTPDELEPLEGVAAVEPRVEPAAEASAEPEAGDAEVDAPVEELEDIELLDDADLIDELDAEAAEDGGEPFVPVSTGEVEVIGEVAPGPRRPMVEASTVVAAINFTPEEDLAEVDFLIESGLATDAREALDDVARRHGEGHPAIQARRMRIVDLEALSHEADKVVAGMGGTEPTPVAPLAAAQVNDLGDADSAAHFDLGVAFMEMGQYKKAIAQLEKVATHKDRRAEALRVMALCDLQQGNPTAAASRLEQALTVPGLTRDGKIGLLYDLATAYEAMGNRLGARLQLRALVDLGASDFLDVRERIHRLGGA